MKVELKNLNNAPKVPKQAEATWDGVINPQNYNFVYNYKLWCSQNPTNQPKPTVKVEYSLHLTGQNKFAFESNMQQSSYLSRKFLPGLGIVKRGYIVHVYLSSAYPNETGKY